MPIDWSPLWLGLRAAGLATLISLPLGVALGYALRDRPRGAAYAAVPLGFPPVIVCAFLLCRYGKVPFRWEFAAAAGIVYAAPFLARAARGAFLNLEPQYLAAARTLGAAEWRVCCEVAVPLRARPILGAAALVFARLFTEFLLVLLLERSL